MFPGTFDPITNGHLDLIDRASNLMNEVIVGVYRSPNKSPLFDAEERLNMVCKSISHMDKASAVIYDGLTVDFARQVKASVLVRGLRAVSDFEYEFALSAMNRRLHPDIDTMFFLSAPEHSFVSSSLIREIGALGRSVEPFVPPNVNVAICEKFAPSADRR